MFADANSDQSRIKYVVDFRKKKSGFANGTVTVPSRYITSNVTKIYRVDYELFGWFYWGIKTKVKNDCKDCYLGAGR